MATANGPGCEKEDPRDNEIISSLEDVEIFERPMLKNLQRGVEPPSDAAVNMTKEYLDQLNYLPGMSSPEYIAHHRLQLRIETTSKCAVCKKMSKKRLNNKAGDDGYYKVYTNEDEQDHHHSDATESNATIAALTCSNPRWSWECLFPSCNFECHLVCVSLITSDLKCKVGKLGNSFSPFITRLFTEPYFSKIERRERFCHYHGMPYQIDDPYTSYAVPIPAFVVEKHDWSRKPVCKSAAVFLSQVKREMDLKAYTNS